MVIINEMSETKARQSVINSCSGQINADQQDHRLPAKVVDCEVAFYRGFNAAASIVNSVVC